VSKALDKSINTAAQYCPLSKVAAMYFTTSVFAVLALLQALKPDW
jgi:hypothetical protein